MTKSLLFESLMNKLEDDENLRNCVHAILMNGDRFNYNPDDASMDLAMMYSFIKVSKGSVKCFVKFN